MRCGLWVSTAVLGAVLVVPAWAEAPVAGVYALPQGAAKVTARLAVSPGPGLRRTLDVAMVPVGGTAPVVRYETELSKELHLIAVSADLRDFVHEHAGRPGRDGHFRVAMRFPHGGPWHVYADAVPQGMGQQVMRFDVGLGAGPAGGEAKPDLAATGLEARDGRYAARFDKVELRAGEEVPLSLHLLRDGRPAPDVVPFLGVAAHAVFIDAGDLSYVHVHAAPAGMAMGEGGMGMAGMPGMGPPLAAGSHVASNLVLHVRAPRAGTSILWVQFAAGGATRTVRFVVPVGS